MSTYNTKNYTGAMSQVSLSRFVASASVHEDEPVPLSSGLRRIAMWGLVMAFISALIYLILVLTDGTPSLLTSAQISWPWQPVIYMFFWMKGCSTWLFLSSFAACVINVMALIITGGFQQANSTGHVMACLGAISGILCALPLAITAVITAVILVLLIILGLILAALTIAIGLGLLFGSISGSR